MNEDTVLHKTELAKKEFLQPHGVLPPKLRRALVLMDGQKTIGELAAFFRPGEMPTVLRELVERGFVSDETGEIPMLDALPEQIAAKGEVDEATFRNIRRKAVREVAGRMGQAGDLLAVQINKCESPEALRATLRNIEHLFADFVGAEQAQAFVKQIGGELLGR